MPQLPDWYHEGWRRHVAHIDQIEKSSQPLVWEPPKVASGWHEVGMEFTMVPDAVHPWNTEVMKAIQRIRPDLVPLWVRWVFKTPPEWGPQEEVVFGRHGLGQIYNDPTHEIPVLKMLAPTVKYPGVRLDRPHTLFLIWQTKTNKLSPSLPGEYKAFDWELYHHVHDNFGYESIDAKQWAHDYIEGIRDQRAKDQKKRQDELEYRLRDVNKFAQKVLENVSEVEMKEYALRDRTAKSSTKPTVYLNG